jgi:Trehalose receptor
MGAATAGAVFYCNASVAALLFWRLAASWRPLMLQWAALERRLCATWPTPSGARWRALAIASTVLILASGMHELYRMGIHYFSSLYI